MFRTCRTYHTFFKNAIILLICFLPSITQAQIGALYTFDFLNLTSSARTTALGGHPIAILDDDVSLGYHNPAVINEKMAHQLSANHNFHFADISHSFFAYGVNLPDKKLSLMIGASNISYGNFDRADIFGNRVDQFSAGETAITLGASRALDERLRLGVNLKYVNSRFDTYGSSGLGSDIGLHYFNPEKRAAWALVIKNIGIQISSYDIQREGFPLDLQLGYSKRLEHLPFQFSITAHHLQKWNLRSPLDDVSQVIFIDQQNNGPSGLSKSIDNFFRHLAFGGEFFIGKNEVFKLRLGYNHLRNKELSVSGFRSLSGFSMGFGIKIKKIRIEYGVGRFHLAGAMNHLSVGMNLNSFFKKI